MTARWQRFGIVIGALSAWLAAAPAHAVLIDQGITYSLTEFLTPNPLTDRFVLGISGINASPGDLEGGRSGVNAIAFNKPDHFSTAAMILPMSGFIEQGGGLNSSGCNGHGNFFCFDNTSIPPTPTTPFAANSSLTFVFDVTLLSGNFAGYNPDFKIDWVGSKNNYDLVSLALAPVSVNHQCTTLPCGSADVSVPEPATLALLALGLAGVGFSRRKQ